MTKKVTLTNLNEIKTLRFKCNSCEAVIELPANKSSNLIIQTNCLSCGKPIHTNYLQAFSKIKEGLKDLNEIKNQNDTAFEIEAITLYE